MLQRISPAVTTTRPWYTLTYWMDEWW